MDQSVSANHRSVRKRQSWISPRVRIFRYCFAIFAFRHCGKEVTIDTPSSLYSVYKKHTYCANTYTFSYMCKGITLYILNEAIIYSLPHDEVARR